MLLLSRGTSAATVIPTIELCGGAFPGTVNFSVKVVPRIKSKREICARDV